MLFPVGGRLDAHSLTENQSSWKRTRMHLADIRHLKRAKRKRYHMKKVGQASKSSRNETSKALDKMCPSIAQSHCEFGNTQNSILTFDRTDEARWLWSASSTFSSTILPVGDEQVARLRYARSHLRNAAQYPSRLPTHLKENQLLGLTTIWGKSLCFWERKKSSLQLVHAVLHRFDGKKKEKERTPNLQRSWDKLWDGSIQAEKFVEHIFLLSRRERKRTKRTNDSHCYAHTFECFFLLRFLSAASSLDKDLL